MEVLMHYFHENILTDIKSLKHMHLLSKLKSCTCISFQKLPYSSWFQLIVITNGLGVSSSQDY